MEMVNLSISTAFLEREQKWEAKKIYIVFK